MIKIKEFHCWGSTRSCYEAHCPPAAQPSFVWSRTTKGCSLTALLRPEPVVVPNFFLPPQQMEASMRMLSISSRPSTVSTGRPSLFLSQLNRVRLFEQEWKHFSLPLSVSAEVRGCDSFRIKENLSDISSLKEKHFQHS